jgi:hypothetical protein
MMMIDRILYIAGLVEGDVDAVSLDTPKAQLAYADTVGNVNESKNKCRKVKKWCGINGLSGREMRMACFSKRDRLGRWIYALTENGIKP